VTTTFDWHASHGGNGALFKLARLMAQKESRSGYRYHGAPDR